MKKETDYSSTIIYKITCKDELVKDVYVGHTTDFVKRKYSHKQDSINGKCKLYAVIRANGGWDNWQMEIINFFNCKDLSEAKQREQEYFISLNATLNSVEPFPVREGKEKKKKIVKESVSETNISETNITTKNFCEKCNFSCNKKSNFNIHLLTRKHKNLNNIVNNNRVYHCKCGKTYKHSSTLSAHRKLCLQNNVQSTNNIISSQSEDIQTLSNMVMELMKSNSDLQKTISGYM